MALVVIVYEHATATDHLLDVCTCLCFLLRHGTAFGSQLNSVYILICLDGAKLSFYRGGKA